MNNNKKTPSIRDAFNQYFEVVPAHSRELLEIAHRIRYEVFSKELGYFDKEQFPDRYEVDENDSISQQCLIKVKSRSLYAGCVRLVPGIRDGQRNRLPFESYYGDKPFSSEFVDFCDLDPSSYGELSRAAVIPHFRRRRSDHDGASAINTKVKPVQQQERRSYPLIGFGLYLASAVMGLNNGYERVFCMMEPRLARRLRIYGINFTQIAPVVEKQDKLAAYKRAAFQITHDELIEGVNPDVSALIKDIRNSFELQLYGAIQSPLMKELVEN